MNVRFFLWMVLAGAMFVSCEGPVGVSGRDAGGVDITPPTVVIDSPIPLTTMWDSLRIVVSAVDNVDIAKVTAAVDGSVYVGGQYLVSFVSPYTFTIDTTGVKRGWHYISSRAYDIAGNSADSPVVPVWFGYSGDLQDTTVLNGFNNGRADTAWTIPCIERINSYWVKITPARVASLDTVRLMLSGNFADTSEVKINVELWEGENLPEHTTTAVPVPWINANLIVPAPRWYWVDFDGAALAKGLNYFFMVSMTGYDAGDTLRIYADNGMPPYSVSGSFDDTGAHYLKDQFGLPNNFLLNCDLYYAKTTP